jgi:hypothetical protein
MHILTAPAQQINEGSFQKLEGNKSIEIVGLFQNVYL